MKNSEQTAFPKHEIKPKCKNGYGEVYEYELVSAGGLTKREYFAAMAMQGIMANSYKENTSEKWIELSVDFSIKLADELLKQLES